MKTTPVIPQWIKEFRYPNYTNIFELLPDNKRLYGTETLFGDWDAEVLFLAKDAAPTQAISDLIKVEGNDAWRHAQKEKGDRGGYLTNNRLLELKNRLNTSVLYGSALSNMLYDGIPNIKTGNISYSQSLNNIFEATFKLYLVKNLKWVISNMPNLKAIACFGNEAWYFTTNALDQSSYEKNSNHFRDSGNILELDFNNKNIRVSAHYHPAARVSREELRKNWDIILP